MNTEMQSEPTTWPQLAEGLYGFLTGRGATIAYELDKLDILVPRDASDTSPHSKWQLDGTIRISTTEKTR